MVENKVREFEQKISSGQDMTAVCLDQIITTQIDEPSQKSCIYQVTVALKGEQPI